MSDLYGADTFTLRIVGTSTDRKKATDLLRATLEGLNAKATLESLESPAVDRLVARRVLREIVEGPEYKVRDRIHAANALLGDSA